MYVVIYTTLASATRARSPRPRRGTVGRANPVISCAARAPTWDKRARNIAAPTSAPGGSGLGRDECR